MRGMEQKRREYKQQLAALLKENTDVDKDRVIALMSTRTGLRHAKIREYLAELEAEGLV